ncbi:ankyrin repeat domain-containing protein [Rickettsia endosymbiont of Oedothorax gibbosus]|uniref:ankyrin repeat domain-containing protein n=1 Tax=Rickettsia endosymbiont of Oedothorax gibbosus TaxID=931099 RepID=UPI0020251945|nr:ankyrin repeat domain-containing protein [Rickettsia endosymbiont of Oedothorax gibbosus]
MADTIKTNPKQRWKDAIGKFKRAIIPEEHDHNGLVDCVRVRVSGTIQQDSIKPYLEEIAQAKQTLGGNEYPILRMNKTELKNHQLFYDTQSNSLVDNSNQTATTLGKESKHTKNIQAFVMAKDGSLYIGTHKGQYSPIEPTLTHASFLGGRPAELAGMISINENGKIDMISSDSGHYAPEPLDMYRGIKKLQKLMPEIFTPDSKINYYDKTTHNMKMSEFLEMMEKPTINGIPLNQELRNERIKQIKEYTENLKNAVSIKIVSDEANLPNIIANLTKEKQQELVEGLKQPMVNLSVIDSEQKPKVYSVSELTISILNSGRADSMQKLLDSGITNRKEFYEMRPLDYAVSQGKTDIVKTMLNNPNMQESLKQQPSNLIPTVLHISAAFGNTDIITEILKYPVGRELLTKKDFNGDTPLEVANRRGNNLAANILEKEYFESAKEQLAKYFKTQMEGKEVITTAHQNEMRKDVIAILSPMITKNGKYDDITEVAGSIVRKSAKIADKKLDWKQKIAEIGDIIKDALPKIFFNKREQKFKNILNDKNIITELQKLRKDYQVKNDNSNIKKITPISAVKTIKNKEDQIIKS